MLPVPDVLPVHRLKERMTFDLLHTHSSNPVLSVSAIPETHTDIITVQQTFIYAQM